MTDCHSRRDTVRIDDQIRANSFLSEWHVFLWIGHTNGTFLAMARGKLISNIGDSDRSHFDFSEQMSITIQGNEHLINFTILRVLQLG